MNEELKRVRDRLRKENQTRGRLAEVARATGVSPRTLYNVVHSEQNLHLATLDKLSAFFKKADKKAVVKT